MPTSVTIRLGTRASPLARVQADWVAELLRQRGHQVVLVPIATAGDRQSSEPIETLPGVGVFTKEIQRALLDGRVDLAVHSLKDLPTEPVAGLTLAAVPPRETVFDVLLSHGGETLDTLPRRARVGTGSLRRRAQLLNYRPDLVMEDIRGNVETRIQKLQQGQLEAIVLAAAGLQRLGLADRAREVLPLSVMMPAVGQGALALESRSDDADTLSAVAPLNDPAARAGVGAERSLLATLQGGCLAPIGAYGRLNPSGRLVLDAVVLNGQGDHRLEASAEDDPSVALDLGRRVAERLLQQGAGELIARGRSTSSDL